MSVTMMHTYWNTPYVLLSIIIAIITSYLGLELARRFNRMGTTTPAVILGTVLGYGIWAMHFIGMLAMQLPTNVAYGLPLTLLSGVSAVAFLIAATLLLSKGTPTIPRIPHQRGDCRSRNSADALPRHGGHPDQCRAPLSGPAVRAQRSDRCGRCQRGLLPVLESHDR